MVESKKKFGTEDHNVSQQTKETPRCTIGTPTLGVFPVKISAHFADEN